MSREGSGQRGEDLWRDAGAASAEIRWTRPREGELGPDDHAELAALLRAAFPTYAHAFPGRRSWSGARPEIRAVAHDSAGAAAHAGLLRRFVQVGDGDLVREQLVAVVGLVAVRPDLQGSGVGRKLGAAIVDALHELAVPFGLLGCGAGTVGFYRAVGWHALPPTRTLYCPLDVDDPSRVMEDSEGWLLFPAAAPIERWPAGEVRWNGAMI